MRLDREQALALALARECGALALAYQSGDLETREKPGDAGPVTRADTEVNARIVTALRAAFPDDDIVAEESGAEMRGRPRCWYVDPIDGTSEYARGEPEWAVHIGLCVDGEPVLGVVHEAGAGRLSWGTRGPDGGAAWLEVDGVAAPLRPSDRGLAALLLVSSKSHASPKILDVMSALAIPPERNLRIGSTGVKMMAIARGVADLYVHPSRGTSLWDICAPHAVLAALGGVATDVLGAPLRYDPTHVTNDRGLLVSHGPHHAEITTAIAAFARTWFPPPAA
jgi:3'-phosphoadenosine 5'-phosphosulfate (PAPS) 3'-phosphatase